MASHLLSARTVSRQSLFAPRLFSATFDAGVAVPYRVNAPTSIECLRRCPYRPPPSCLLGNFPKPGAARQGSAPARQRLLCRNVRIPYRQPHPRSLVLIKPSSTRMASKPLNRSAQQRSLLPGSRVDRALSACRRPRPEHGRLWRNPAGRPHRRAGGVGYPAAILHRSDCPLSSLAGSTMRLVSI